MRRTALAIAGSLLIASCGAGSSDADTPIQPVDPVASSSADERRPSDGADRGAVADVFDGRIVTTASVASGNRVIGGPADLAAPPITVALDGRPRWVVGTELAGDLLWVVVLADGEVVGLRLAGETIERFDVGVGRLPEGMPPVLLVDDEVRLLEPPEGASPLSAPVPTASGVAATTPEGRFTIGAQPVEAITALADSRIVISAAGDLAVLTDPTTEYQHGIIGDQVEAASVSVLDPATGAVVGIARSPEGAVFEAISPMWADLDGDGVEEILVTASNGEIGARLVAFEADGTPLAVSEAIGRGGRWLNQMGVAAVGPNGELEIVEVRTPHIGGIVRWLRLVDGSLEVVAESSTYTSHVIGSRNLDQGLIVDADGDGRLDALLGTQDQTTLVALTRVGDGAEPVVEVDLGGTLTSNIAGVERAGGTAAIAAGTSEDVLLIWP